MNVSHVFIDGSHHYDDVVNDCHLAMKLINGKPGCIILDDLQVPDVLKAFNHLLFRYSNSLTSLAHVGGETVCRVYVNGLT